MPRMERARTTSVLLGLGANQGDRHANLRRGIALLAYGVGTEVVRVSSWIETSPEGGPPQGPYLNGAVEIRSSLQPRRLLTRLHTIERQLGRVRGTLNGPRPLDLDILLHGDLVIDEPGLVIPHPRMLERGFVLGPLAEIAPERLHPITGRTVREHWAAWRAARDGDVARTSAPRFRPERRSRA